MLQQLCRSRIDIDAHTVDRLGHDEVQSFFEPCRRQIMLILPDPQRLWIDLDQLCQRIDDPTGDGNGGTLFDLQLRKLLSGQRTGRIHAGAGLAHQGKAHGQLFFADEMSDEGFALPGSRPIADGDDRDRVDA